MKLVLFTDNRPGLLQDDGVVDLSETIRLLGASNGQAAMEAMRTHIDDLAGELSRLPQEGEVLPLPRPKKILCMGGNYREFGARQPSPRWGFLKSPSAISGPGDTGSCEVSYEMPASQWCHDESGYMIGGTLKGRMSGFWDEDFLAM